MSRTTTAILSGLALTLASGCSQLSGTFDKVDSRRATTNATRIKDSPYSTTFNKATYETLQADGRDFVLTQRNLGYTVSTPAGTVSKVLDDQMIPLDNSQRFRTPDHIKFKPKTEKYFLVNGFFDDAGTLHINNETDTKASYFVLEKRTFTETPSPDLLSSVQREVIERLTKTKPGAKFRDTKYIHVVIGNQFGPDKALIDRTSITPLIMEDSTVLPDGTTSTTFRFGVTAVGYIPTSGTEIAPPIPPAPEQPKVIEGIPNPN
jgi:hypothetical protein